MIDIQSQGNHFYMTWKDGNVAARRERSPVFWHKSAAKEISGNDLRELGSCCRDSSGHKSGHFLSIPDASVSAETQGLGDGKDCGNVIV
jgi:hypothetical protein